MTENSPAHTHTDTDTLAPDHGAASERLGPLAPLVSGPAFERFDRTVDSWADRLRGMLAVPEVITWWNVERYA